MIPILQKFLEAFSPKRPALTFRYNRFGGYAKALLSSFKDIAESFALKITVIGYGSAPILANQKIKIALEKICLFFYFFSCFSDHFEGVIFIIESQYGSDERDEGSI